MHEFRPRRTDFVNHDAAALSMGVRRYWFTATTPAARGASRVHLPVVTLIAISAIVSPAIAETQVAAIHPQPTLESVLSLREVSVSTAAPSGIEAAHEAARVKMRKFDLDIAGRDIRVLRSVCVGCRTRAKWAARIIKTRADNTELLIADPSAAPDQ